MTDVCQLCGSPLAANRSMNGAKFCRFEYFYECGSVLAIENGERCFVPKCKCKPQLVCSELARQLLESLPAGHELKLNLSLRRLAGL